MACIKKRDELARSISESYQRIKKSYSDGPYIKILIFLTLIGLLLRLYHMGDVSLWLDEVTALHRSQQSFLEIWTNPSGDINPPLFFWIEHLMLSLGSSEFVLRLAPALIGTLTIPVMYGIGTEFYDRNIGVISAALLTFSTFHLWYSQEARPYALLLFLLLIALFFFLRALRTDRTLYWIFSGLFLGLACWTHNAAIVGIPIFVVWLLISRFRLPLSESIGKPLVVTFATFLLVVSPFIPYLFGSYSGKINEPLTWGIRGPELIKAMGIQYFGGIGTGHLITVYLFAVLFLLGLIQLFRTDVRKFLLLVIAILIPLTSAWVLSYTMPTDPRYFIILIAFIFIGIAFVFLPFRTWFSPTRFLGIAIIVIALLCVPSLHSYYSLDAKWEDWKGITREIQDLTGEGDLIIIIPTWSTPSFRYYDSHIIHNLSVYNAESADQLGPIVAAHQGETIYFICSENIIEPYRWIAGNATLVKEFGEHHIYKFNTGPLIPSHTSDNETSTSSLNNSNNSTITVVDPNGGENWFQGSHHTISWRYSGNPGSAVRIELLERSVVYGVVTHNTSVGSDGTGTFSVIVPKTMRLGTDYKIQVISIDNPTYSDMSNRTFNISAG